EPRWVGVEVLAHPLPADAIVVATREVRLFGAWNASVCRVETRCRSGTGIPRVATALRISRDATEATRVAAVAVAVVEVVALLAVVEDAVAADAGAGGRCRARHRGHVPAHFRAGQMQGEGRIVEPRNVGRIERQRGAAHGAEILRRREPQREVDGLSEE